MDCIVIITLIERIVMLYKKVLFWEFLDCFDNDLEKHDAEELQEIWNRIILGIMSIHTEHTVIISDQLKNKNCAKSVITVYI